MIAKMERLEIICLREALPTVTPFLQGEGLMDMEQVPLDVKQAPNFLSRIELQGDECRERDKVAELDRMLRELVPLLPGKYPQPVVAEAIRRVGAFDADGYRARARTLYRELRGIARRRTNAQDNLQVLKNYEQLLNALAPVIGARKVTFGANARAIVLQGDVTRAVEQLQERLSAVVGPQCEFIRQSVGGKKIVGAILYPEDKNDAVGRVLREEGIAPVDMPEKAEAGASVPEVLGRVRAAIAGQDAALKGLQSELDAFGKTNGAEIVAMAKIVADRLAEFTVTGQFAGSEMLAVVHGWVPADDGARFKKAIEDKFGGDVMVSTLSMKGVPHHTVPTLLKNHPIFKPFELLLGFLKPPTYGTYDATWLVAISFILFYGFILGDAGYGLIICLAAWWIRRKWGYNEIARSIAVIVFAMGASSIVFGIIYLEIFGDAVEKLTGWHAPFHRGHETGTLLLIGILFGVIHIPLALFLGIREDFRHGHTKHGYEKLGMLMGLTAVIIGVCGNFGVPVVGSTPMMYVAGALGIAAVGLLFYVMGAMGAVAVLEIVSLGGNVLSYARLMALGIASIALAQIANDAAREAGFIGVLIAIVVHVLNIGIGVFSPTVHSLRLNYVEFLPKFYSAEGRPYKPFKKEATW